MARVGEAAALLGKAFPALAVLSPAAQSVLELTFSLSLRPAVCPAAPPALSLPRLVARRGVHRQPFQFSPGMALVTPGLGVNVSSPLVAFVFKGLPLVL